jgi:hypothetical protein
MSHERRQQERAVGDMREEEAAQQHLQLVAKARVRHVCQLRRPHHGTAKAELCGACMCKVIPNWNTMDAGGFSLKIECILSQIL